MKDHKYKNILEEYNRDHEAYQQLGGIVAEEIRALLQGAEIEFQSVEFRVKTKKSLENKIERKNGKYRSLKDVTDVLGVRVICYFADDVDRVAEKLERQYRIDWDNSVDKRAQMNPNAFGYLALHYICVVPEHERYPSVLWGVRFEIQMFSMLQQVWNLINHDLGYKTDYGIPRKVARDFSRVAGLLEIADMQFMSIRDSVHNYSNEIHWKIANNQADDVEIDRISLEEYVYNNRELYYFYEKLRNVCGTEIHMTSPENYISQLRYLGKHTIGDLQNMQAENRYLAVRMAQEETREKELDILSSNAVLRFLCHAEMINRKYPEDIIVGFMSLTVKEPGRALRRARNLIDKYGKMQGV